MTPNLLKMKRALRVKRYSPNTQKVYQYYLCQFELFLSPNSLQASGEKEVQAFVLTLIEKNASISAQNQAINAIKFYHEQILMRPRSTYSLQRPFKEKKLPIVLSQDEITTLFSSINNLKHKVMLMTIYSGVLRIG